ncbi:deoxyribose-phosphate aldolase [Odoribacter sp. Z80]|uniref:deoxyribose-phosphate aldolase n=1 Tax=Odoribacter sp. Z80 TaxID=2304575 RepID=UPI00137A4CC1|nr:deoxyribose-phosphate aldolase [Odoribacter sp. Z80]NCE72211.1 deoxyribose-phosphate aldolase [Odoribacter sp. Z80]
MDNIAKILTAYNCVNLDERIQFELDGVVEKEIKQVYCAENLEFCLSCIDYTTLKLTDTEKSVKVFVTELLKKLKKFNLREVAAVCVFPNFARVVREALQETGIQTAVVAGNFPSSQTFTEIKLAECKMAISAGAQEVDVVISVGDMLEKNYEKVFRELKAIRKVCETVRLKVILETGELKDVETIFYASLIAAYAGADFIKTSTGKVPVNATPESVYVMCEAIKQYFAQTGRRVGLKVAGGVSKAQNAIRYVTIVNHVLGSEWLTPYYFRIGASMLMDDVVKEIKALKMKVE